MTAETDFEIEDQTGSMTGKMDHILQQSVVHTVPLLPEGIRSVELGTGVRSVGRGSSADPPRIGSCRVGERDNSGGAERNGLPER